MPVSGDFQFDAGGLMLGDGTDYAIVEIEGLDQPELRTSDAPNGQDEGAFFGEDFVDFRTIRLQLEVVKTTGSLLAAALEDLVEVTLPNADVLWKFQIPGSGVRRFTARCRTRRTPLDHDYARNLARVDLILHAEDPRLYSDTLVATNVPATNTQTAIPNGGTFPAPFVARFMGPCTNASPYRLINDATSSSIDLTINLAALAYVDVDILNRTAVSSTPSNVYSNITRFDDMDIPVGGATQFRSTASGTTGATIVTVSARNTYISAP